MLEIVGASFTAFTVSAKLLLADKNPSLTLTPPCGVTTTLQLTVKDDFWVTATDTVDLIVAPPTTTANAGPDQTVSGTCTGTTAVTLSGSAAVNGVLGKLKSEQFERERIKVFVAADVRRLWQFPISDFRFPI